MKTDAYLYLSIINLLTINNKPCCIFETPIRFFFPKQKTPTCYRGSWLESEKFRLFTWNGDVLYLYPRI